MYMILMCSLLVRKHWDIVRDTQWSAAGVQHSAVYLDQQWQQQ